MPSVEKNILSLPFTRGLSQKEDPRWLEPGSMLTALNAEHPKTNILQKRAGHTKLTTAAVSSGAGLTTSIIKGRRLATAGGLLLQVGQDSWTDALWSYDEQGAQWDFIDRVPEVYVLPDRTVASQGTVIREVDSVICNGYRVICYLAPPVTIAVQGSGQPTTNQVNNTGQVYVKVENAQTGEVVLAPELIGFLPFAFYDQAAPKLIAQGTSVIIGVIAGTYTNLPASGPPTTPGTYSLYLATMDMTKPWLGFGAALALSGITAPTSAFDIRDVGAWDIAATPFNNNTFGVVYQTGNVGSAVINLTMLVTSSPPAVVQTTNLNQDTTYASDGKLALTAMALDLGALASGNAAIAYGYRIASSGTTRVMMQLWTWAIGSTNLFAAANVMAPANTPKIDAPHAIALSPPISANQTYYKLAFGPRQAQWEAQHPDGLAGAATAVTVLMTLGPTLSGTMDRIPNASLRVTWGIIPASRWLPNINGIGYIICRCPSFEQGTHFLMADDAWQDFTTPEPNAGGGYDDAYPMRLVATFAPRLSSSVISYGQVTPAPFVLADQRVPHTLPHVSNNPNADGGTIYEALITASSVANAQDPMLVQWDTASKLAYNNAELGPLTGIATGCPSLTDGVRVHEFAFPLYPSILSVNSFGVTGGLTIGAAYKWIATYEWVDSKGQVHRSGRSAAVGMTSAGSLAEMNITSMSFSAKEKAFAATTPAQSPQGWGSVGPHLRMRLWRTLANGTVYHFVAEYRNATGSNFSTFFITDQAPDSLISSAPLLYGDGLDGVTQGSIKDNLTPPAFQAMCVHKNRFFGVDGTNVWATKELVPGEGPGFNEAFAFSWDDTSDPITAIFSLDDKLGLCKRNSVAIVTGEGPEDNGGQNDWSPPQVIATDLGAVDWRSICVKADGVYFMSDAGLRMLTRDMQVVPVPQVEDALTANPSVTSAIVHPSAGRVSITSGNVRIDHNYVLDCWTTAQTQTGGDSPTAPISAVVADAPSGTQLVPIYHWLDSSGAVWRESSTSYEDAGTYVGMQAETAWIKAEGIEGFARFRRLQVTWQNADPHALSVYVAFDYGSTYYLMGTVTAAQMTAMQTPLCQVLFSLPRQRAEAVRFKLVDSQDAVTPPVTGQGPVLISMGLEVSTYTNRRTNRLPSAQRV